MSDSITQFLTLTNNQASRLTDMVAVVIAATNSSSHQASLFNLCHKQGVVLQHWAKPKQHI